MWFLIKGTFWFSLVLVLLPMVDRSAQETLEAGPSVEIGGAFGAASEALSYVGAMCVEKPDVCQKGAETVVALGHRAREGARVAFEFLDARFAPSDALKTGTVARDAGETSKAVPAIADAGIDDILNLPIPAPRPRAAP
ncbi:DUF5330 domain-containing protein [Ensifer soli]|uniref:DUF5330 domain-containing protein n=1 Tax=Ciceribacter sp. sgz301302 TaxID=3342379 RepID=UPI0035B83A87